MSSAYNNPTPPGEGTARRRCACIQLQVVKEPEMGRVKRGVCDGRRAHAAQRNFDPRNAGDRESVDLRRWIAASEGAPAATPDDTPESNGTAST